METGTCSGRSLSLSLSFSPLPLLDRSQTSKPLQEKRGLTTFENRYFVERRHWGKNIGASSNADLQFKLTWIDRSVLSIASCVHVNYDLGETVELNCSSDMNLVKRNNKAKSAGHPLGTKMSKSPKSMMKESREQLCSEMERKGQIADESSIGKRLVFVTNNSTKCRKQYGKKFETLGLNVNEEEIFASSFAAAAYLKSINFPKDKKLYSLFFPRSGYKIQA